MRPYFISLLAFLFLSCSKEKSESPSDFELYKNKWESLAVDSYSYTFQISCFCLMEATLPKNVVVYKNQIVNVDGLSYDNEKHGSVLTIDQLFDFIEESEKNNVHLLEVTYHSKKGYPISLYIDQDEMIADEEMGYYVSDFKD